MKFSKIAFPILNGTLFISWEEISCFKSEDNYSTLIDIHGNTHFIYRSLKWVENRLEAYCFYRVHKSYLINIAHIVQYKKNGTTRLHMQCGGKIPVSKTKHEELTTLMSCFYSMD